MENGTAQQQDELCILIAVQSAPQLCHCVCSTYRYLYLYGLMDPILVVNLIMSSPAVQQITLPSSQSTPTRSKERSHSPVSRSTNGFVLKQSMSSSLVCPIFIIHGRFHHSLGTIEVKLCVKQVKRDSLQLKLPLCLMLLVFLFI